MLRCELVVVVVDDDDDEAGGRPIEEEATKLAIARLDTAVEGLGSDAVHRMVPTKATIFIVVCCSDGTLTLFSRAAVTNFVER